MYKLNSEEVLEKKVSGEYNTYRVYIHMLKTGKSTARRVFRDLGMSSPSLALLHLDKLVKLGLLRKVDGDYELAENPRKLGMLKVFHLIGSWFVPRYFLYFIFFASISAYFLVQTLTDHIYIIPLAVSVLSAVINLYEAVHIYRILPQF